LLPDDEFGSIEAQSGDLRQVEGEAKGFLGQRLKINSKSGTRIQYGDDLFHLRSAGRRKKEEDRYEKSKRQNQNSL